MADYKNPYQVLGLPPEGATHQEVKDAYRRLCMQHHPDLCPEHLRPAAEKYFKEISSAYTLLTRRGSGAEASTSGASHHAAWAARAYATRPAPAKYSNGVVGAVIAAPLVLLGMWLQFKADAAQHSPDPLNRPHGLLHPPINPYLRDDLRPKTQNRGFWSKSSLSPSIPRPNAARNGAGAAESRGEQAAAAAAAV